MFVLICPNATRRTCLVEYIGLGQLDGRLMTGTHAMQVCLPTNPSYSQTLTLS